jgi:Flp pilus assembly pilin Flp
MAPSSDCGQTNAEYAVVLGMITIGIVLVIASISGAIVRLFAGALAAFA